jgi:hypothetical protein
VKIKLADAGLRLAVRNHLDKSLGWLWTAIETAATQQGVPDSFWAHRPSQTSGWIEHKAARGWVVTVRPHQIAWIERHVAAGVHCTVMVRAMGLGSAAGAGDALWVISGAAVRELAQAGLRDLSSKAVLGMWPGTPNKWNWLEVERLLTGRQHDR